MNRFHLTLLVVLVFLLNLVHGCKDSGTVVLTTPLSFDLLPLAPATNDTSQAFLSGGTSPYTIVNQADLTIARVSISGSVLSVIGIATGTTAVTIGDASTPQNLITIPLVVETPVSFANQLMTIFNSNTYGCIGCHGGSGGLFIAYSNLVNVEAEAGCIDKKRVKPRDPANSVLFLRLSGLCEERMPQGGNPIAAGDLELIRKWIAQGARNN